MLFIQPVVVSDAQTMDLATPAEVRQAETRTAQAGLEQPDWTSWSATLLAQSGMDSRSPFGPNAVDHNDLTPPSSAPHQPTDTVETPAAPTPADSSSNTRIPPAEAAPGQTDAGPPGTPNTTATPGIAPSTETPPTPPATETPATTPSTATPGTAPGTETPRAPSNPTPRPGSPGPVTSTGAGLAPGTSSPSTQVNPYTPSSSTFPGARQASLPGSSSGASNSQ